MNININGKSETFKFSPATPRRLKQLGWKPEDLENRLSKKLPLLERLSNLTDLIWCMAPAPIVAQYPKPDDSFAAALDIAIFNAENMKAIGVEMEAAAAQMMGTIEQ